MHRFSLVLVDLFFFRECLRRMSDQACCTLSGSKRNINKSNTNCTHILYGASSVVPAQGIYQVRVSSGRIFHDYFL